MTALSFINAIVAVEIAYSVGNRLLIIPLIIPGALWIGAKADDITKSIFGGKS